MARSAFTTFASTARVVRPATLRVIYADYDGDVLRAEEPPAHGRSPECSTCARTFCCVRWTSRVVARALAFPGEVGENAIGLLPRRFEFCAQFLHDNAVSTQRTMPHLRGCLPLCSTCVQRRTHRPDTSRLRIAV